MASDPSTKSESKQSLAAANAAGVGVDPSFAAGSETVSPQPSPPTLSDFELTRRYRVLNARAERAGVGWRKKLCPFCAKELAGLPKHFQREHRAAVAALPASYFGLLPS